MAQGQAGQSVGWILFAGSLCLGATGCKWVKSDTSTALSDAYDLAESLAQGQVQAFQANDGVFKRVKFDELRYQKPANLETTPSITPACAVRYVLGDKVWGIVPNLTYDCDNAESKKLALERAPHSLRGLVAVAPDEQQAVLEGHLWPRQKLETLGPNLVAARVLDAPFQFDSCAKIAAERLLRSEAGIQTLRCGIFVAPGARVQELRSELGKARALISDRLSVPEKRTAEPATEAQLTAAEAQAAAAQFEVPGSATATASGKPLAYKLTVVAREHLQVDLSSSEFDSVLEIRDASGARIVERDDDSGGQRSARIVWSPPTSGEFVVVVRTSGKGPNGHYELKISQSGAWKLTPDAKQKIQNFAAWYDKLADTELADEWRAGASEEFQVSCLNQARFENASVVAQLVNVGAERLCEVGLSAAVQAKRDLVPGDARSADEKRESPSHSSKIKAN